MKFDTKQINILGGVMQVKVPIDQVQAIGDLQKAVNAGKVLEVEIKVKRKKRSINANSLCWQLCGEIAKKLPLHSDQDVYRKAIREAGKKEYVTIANKALNHFEQIWSSNGIGWFVEKITETRSMQECSTLALCYGSSEYNTAEMARLIDYLVEEAKALGCDVISEADRQLLLEEWGKDNDKG